MKRLLHLCLVVSVALSMVVAPVYAGDEAGSAESSYRQQTSSEYLPYQPSKANPPAEYMLADAFIIRPIAAAATIIGLIAGTAMYPLAISTHSEDQVTSEFFYKPYQFTTRRPLGDIDYSGE